jgi:hypothetical protein
MGSSHFAASKMVLYQCVRGRNLARRVYSHDEPYYDRLDSRLPQIRVRCQVDIDRMPSNV